VGSRRPAEEAARVDGCHPLWAFWKLTLPLVVPGLIATGVLSFIFSWNDFTIALNLTSARIVEVTGASAGKRDANEEVDDA